MTSHSTQSASATSIGDRPDASCRPPAVWWTPIAIVLLALLMGLPTIRGGFVGGDDHRLVLNHVLVSRPSIDHAIKLFTIAHRDLYQPLPLLSFSAEFAVADALGLFEGGEGGERGAWLFHLSNIVLHAACALLVYLLLRRIQRHEFVAIFVAGLFAIHPLQVEVVAWVNGRMMLLSTLFALLSLLSMLRFFDRPRAGWAVLTVLLVLLCSISKVRVGLPVLMGVVAIAQHCSRAVAPARCLRAMTQLGKGFWIVWAASTLVVLVLLIVNVQATSEAGLLAGGESLGGPRLVRVLLALANYVSHLFWPAGLSSYYPTPGVVAWGDAGTLRAAAIVLPAIVVALIAAFRSRAALLGLLWFASTLASTLPIIPARNLLAADRYMYLPMIGGLWLIATILLGGWAWLVRRGSERSAKRVVAIAAVGLIVSLIPISWHVGASYSNPLAKTQRIVDLFPDTPRVWYPLGSVHLDLAKKAAASDDQRAAAHHFDLALHCARQELRHDDAVVRCRAMRLMGQTRQAMGEPLEAIAALREAIALDPVSVPARFSLAIVLDELGRSDESLTLYESIVHDAPGHNAAAVRLARRYRALGRAEDARRLFEKAIETNPYEVSAIETLSEMDLALGTTAGARAAADRLTFLLEWMPDHLEARTNLGTALRQLGREAGAVEAYREVIRRAPGHIGARLNLAYAFQAAGRHAEALSLFGVGTPLDVTNMDEAIAVHDLFEGHGKYARCLALWRRFLATHSDSQPARAFMAWSIALAGDHRRAQVEVDALIAGDAPPPLAWATATYIALSAGDPAAIEPAVDGLCATGRAGIRARARLARAISTRSDGSPRSPWSDYVTARLLITDGATQHAGPLVDRFEQSCQGPACAPFVARLRTAISAAEFGGP